MLQDIPFMLHFACMIAGLPGQADTETFVAKRNAATVVHFMGEGRGMTDGIIL
jgi:hypothetical protein